MEKFKVVVRAILAVAVVGTTCWLAYVGTCGSDYVCNPVLF
jgi:hypothetical protein